MKPADADAIARFVQQGGQVNKVVAPIPTTEGQVVAYLADGCGLTVKFFPGDLKPYACRGRRYSIHGLIGLANIYRTAQQLPPITLDRHVTARTAASKHHFWQP